MAQTTALIKTLKKELKANSLTYADVAKQLDLTQASIKRLFSEENISLVRLDLICQMMDIEISDLVKKMTKQQGQLQHLSVAQEEEITKDIKLLLITVCVLNKWTMDEIVTYYQIAQTQCIQYLAKLDRLKLIDLLPGNRIKLRVDSNFGWLENGPIQKFFRLSVGNVYFNSQFEHEDEILLVLNGMLSKQSNAQFQRKIKRLAHEFELLNQEDSNLPLDDRIGITAVLAIRGWRHGLFEHLQKQEQIKTPFIKKY
ncbi:MAG: helix-turn-helix transcriptional regulator [Saccharospirillaceae bacterium]|nr:helix-turn-helix transcriptional regulator [Pseudomonadales bacterium]NRB77484.1 helix-turn-helix transcriptional regulator [Saccharospirillaceae bacterium]